MLSLLQLLAPHECFACGQEGFVLCCDCQIAHVKSVPLRCYRCHRSSPEALTCLACQVDSPLIAVWVAGAFEGPLRETIHALKFKRVKAAARDLALLTDSLLMTVALPDNPVLVPIPTATTRIRERGYDQALLIAKQLSRRRRWPLAAVLKRVNQVRQTGQSKLQRQEQLHDAFRISSRENIQNRTVILIDDVLTTGATLEAAARYLKQCGAGPLYALVCAQKLTEGL